VAAIDRELALFAPALAAKPQILVLTKKDVLQDPAVLTRAKAAARRLARPLVAISAVTGDGLDELLRAADAEVRRLDVRDPGVRA